MNYSLTANIVTEDGKTTGTINRTYTFTKKSEVRALLKTLGGTIWESVIRAKLKECPMTPLTLEFNKAGVL